MRSRISAHEHHPSGSLSLWERAGVRARPHGVAALGEEDGTLAYPASPTYPSPVTGLPPAVPLTPTAPSQYATPVERAVTSS